MVRGYNGADSGDGSHYPACGDERLHHKRDSKGRSLGNNFQGHMAFSYLYTSVYRHFGCFPGTSHIPAEAFNGVNALNTPPSRIMYTIRDGGCCAAFAF